MKAKILGMTTFHFLCWELRPLLKQYKTVRVPLSAEQRVALCLTTLGSNSEMKIVSKLSGVGLSTTCVAFHEVAMLL